MTKRPLNVLSIDFDVFQVVSADTMKTCYPDGIDLPSTLSSIVWQSHYGNPDTYQNLMKITTNVDMINELKDLIAKSLNTRLPDSCICNSHRHIYNFIMKHYDRICHNGIELTHLDMHHDLFNDNKELDCGNWISHLKNAVKTNVTWIANPISKAMYGMTEPIFDNVRTDLSDIKNPNWDLIFLCRSDNWVPPHLDANFVDLAIFILNNSLSCQYEENILESRWTDGFVHGFEQLQNMYKETMKEMIKYE